MRPPTNEGMKSSSSPHFVKEKGAAAAACVLGGSPSTGTFGDPSRRQTSAAPSLRATHDTQEIGRK